MFISLRYKFLAIIILLLVASILSFLFLATGLFNSDKKAYIYDNNASFTEALAEETNTGIQSIVKTLRLVAITFSENNKSKDKLIKELFAAEPNFVDLSVYQVNQAAQGLTRRLHIVDKEYLAPYHLDESYFDKLSKKKPINVAGTLRDGFFIQNATLASGAPLMTVAITLDKKFIIAANVAQDKRLQIFNRSKIYSTYLLDRAGGVLAHSDQKQLLDGATLPAKDVIEEIISSNTLAGAKEYISGENSFIAAYRKLSEFNLLVLSEIPTDKAYAASKRLLEKSVLFALLIMAVSFVVSIPFTRKLTAAIQRLYLATIKISKGDFNLKVPIKTKDEIGSLSSAFNKMAGEIVRLIKETADKARMEKEIETAQIVADNFIPNSDVTINDYQISSFFKPASECGGDWWGYQRFEDSIIIMLGDATGHGVGAALITAAVHSCNATLKWLMENKMISELSPARIMSCLNTAVYQAGKAKVKMTFFIAKIHLASGKISYCNASHDMPFTCPSTPAEGDVLNKSDLESLTGNPDPCLGQNLETKFQEFSFQLKNDCSLIMYSDGLTECTNDRAEEYGERRLLKSIFTAAHQSAKSLKTNIVTKAIDFFGSNPQNDDITLVIVKRMACCENLERAG